ncbi:MAG: DUF6089 family protein [Chitinophagaceae bacterium]
MKNKFQVLILLLICTIPAIAQDEFNGEVSIGTAAGLVNYDGDLQPHSFNYSRSKPILGLYLRKPLYSWLAVRVGGSLGTISASDKNNRDYLKYRNLSFQTSYKELYTGVEFLPFDLERFILTPYVFGGVAVFRYNPWTIDENQQKVFLQPLSTEGQGLEEYPERKPYKLTQGALAIAYGVRCALSNYVHIGVEFHQRKTFTDYLDDVSSTYVDYNRLLEFKGQKSVDLAFRADEIDISTPYPPEGEIRGTAKEKDWVYYLGVTVDVRFTPLTSSIGRIFAKKDPYNRRCPTRF